MSRFKTQIGSLVSALRSKACSVFNEKLKTFFSYLSAHPEKRNLGLAGLNLALLFLLFVQFNLIGLFATGYEAADLLLDLDQEDVEAIVIRDPDFKNKRVRLVRQKEKKLERSQGHSKDSSKKDSFFSSFYKSAPAQYAWQLELYDIRETKDAKTEEKQKSVYPADAQRIAEFFLSLRQARRYYAVPRTSEKEKAIGMQRDSQGKYANLQITFLFSPEKKTLLYLGRASSRSGENYVRRDEEKNIYLVQTDLRGKIGSAEPLYFRDRRILSTAVQEKGLISIMAQKKQKGRERVIAHFTYNGKEWNLQSPPSTLGAKVRPGAVQSFVKDIFSWKASEFPEKLPKGLDSRYAFTLTLRYKETGDIQEKEIKLDILGREGYSDYVLIMPDKSLRKVSSVYLEDILDPLKNFTEPSKKKK